MTKYIFAYLVGLLAHYQVHIQLNSIVLNFVLIITASALIAKRYFLISTQLVIILVMMLGYSIFAYASLAVKNNSWPDNIYKNRANILVDIEQSTNYYSIANVQNIFIGNEYLKNIKGKIKIKHKYKQNPEFIIGEYVWIYGQIERPDWYKNSGCFNSKKYNWLNGIQAEIKLYEYAKTTKLKTSIRNYLLNTIKSRYTYSHMMPIVLALLLGDKSLIVAEDKEVFIKTGTAHLIAISGLHIGIIYIFANLIAMRFVMPVIANMIGLVFATIYAIVAGSHYSCQRALIFLFLIVILKLLNRGYSKFQIIAIAFILISLSQPLCIYDYGFWMSFVAVFSIAIFNGYNQKTNIILRLVYFQYTLFLLFLPIGLCGIGSPSYLAVLTNIYAVPVFSIFIMPLVFILGALLLCSSDYLADEIFKVIDIALSVLITTQDYILEQTKKFQLPESNTEDVGIIIIFSIFSLSMFFKQIAFSRGLLLITMSMIWFGGTRNKVGYGDVKINVIDVGQGTSVLIQTATRNLLYDTGTKKAGKYAVAPFLNSQFIQNIDALVVSHWDTDHSGGLPVLREKFKINEVISYDFRDGVDSLCRKNKRWEWDGVNFEFIYPASTDLNLVIKENNRSCVLKVSTKTQGFSLLGDIEAKVEKQIYSEKTNKLESESILVAHHGSKTSTSTNLLNSLNPQLAIISAGQNNSYGHPHSKVIESLLLKNVRIRTTGDCGLVTIELSDKLGGYTSATCYEHSLKNRPYNI